MDIYFLGTSAGTPTKTRNVSAVAVTESKGRGWYLIDCGEGTQHQLLHTKLSLNSLKAIFITHIHGDHCYGLPGLLSSASMAGRTEPLTIVAPKGIKEWCEASTLHTSLYLTYELTFLEPDSFRDLSIGQFCITSTELSHVIPSFAYSFTEAQLERKLNVERLNQKGIPRGELWGTLQSGKDVEYQGTLIKSSDFVFYDRQPRKIIVCGDNDNPDLLADECKNCHVLVHEATFTKDLADKAMEFGHSYAGQVAVFAQKLSIPNLVLTHFSPRYQQVSGAKSSIADIQREAESSYDGDLFLANDFDRFRLDKTGQLEQLDRNSL